MSLGAVWLGRVGYDAAVTAMEQRRQRVLDGDVDAQAILLCEHDPVVTRGRNADPDNLLASESELSSNDVAIRTTSRGGDFTYHGPGQLMIYPVYQIREGLVRYLEAVAGAVIAAAAEAGVEGAAWRRDPAGVWIGDRKLAACGVHVSRRVAIHGFSLNVSTPAGAWDCIVPCGIRGNDGSGVVSLEDLLGPRCPSVARMAEVAMPILRRALSD